MIPSRDRRSDASFGNTAVAYTSWEVAVLNYSRKEGDFAEKGDSGAAIFNAEGKLAAILHSGSPSTFGTPGHYVVELVKRHYSHADFDCLEFEA